MFIIPNLNLFEFKIEFWKIRESRVLGNRQESGVKTKNGTAITLMNEKNRLCGNPGWWTRLE